jgi:hypothetical protein
MILARKNSLQSCKLYGERVQSGNAAVLASTTVSHSNT